MHCLFCFKHCRSHIPGSVMQPKNSTSLNESWSWRNELHAWSCTMCGAVCVRRWSVLNIIPQQTSCQNILSSGEAAMQSVHMFVHWCNVLQPRLKSSCVCLVQTVAGLATRCTHSCHCCCRPAVSCFNTHLQQCMNMCHCRKQEDIFPLQGWHVQCRSRAGLIAYRMLQNHAWLVQTVMICLQAEVCVHQNVSSVHHNSSAIPVHCELIILLFLHHFTCMIYRSFSWVVIALTYCLTPEHPCQLLPTHVLIQHLQERCMNRYRPALLQ